MTTWIGTNAADLYTTAEAGIRLEGRGGDDGISASGADSSLYGGRGDDLLESPIGHAAILDGGAGDDTIKAGGGDDGIFVAIDGGAGYDTLVVRARIVSLQLESLTGIERIVGTMNESSGGSRFWPSIAGSDGDNIFDFSGVRVKGISRIYGKDGDDRIIGAHRSEVICGGRGSDTLAGGGGRDVFEFTKVSDSSPGSKTHDTITDFGARDILSLRMMDADRLTDGYQRFVDLGHAAFSGHAGEVRYEVCACGDTVVEADVNGDAIGDLLITLTGAHDEIHFAI